jgi:hypothetical protein
MSSTPYSCQILIELEFSRQISENPQIQNFIKIRPVEVALLHVDGGWTAAYSHRQTRRSYGRFSQICAQAYDDVKMQDAQRT